MKKYFYHSFILLLLSYSISYAQYNPQHELGELFADVQLAPVFPDSKTFVDCIPKFSPDTILKQYREQKKQADFDLAVFVQQNFIIPQAAAYIDADTFPHIEVHIEKLWDKLVRSDSVTAGSLIELPFPYIVPGGRFNEMYYWDSYFTLLGLQVSGKDQLVEDMVDNFAWLIQTYGFIPNGTRTYYLSRSQPPFFALMVELLATIKGEEVLSEYLPQLVAEHQFWMKGEGQLNRNNNAIRRVVKLADNSVLNRYWDNDSIPRPEAYKEDVETASRIAIKPEITYRNLRAAAESGWDFSARWFRDGLSLETIHTTEIIPVDLNSLLYHLERTIAKAYALKDDRRNSEFFSAKAEVRKRAILKYCWNPTAGYFMDYDFVAEKHTGFYSLAGMAPLYFSIAEKDQAEKVAQNIKAYFLFPGGLSSTLILSGQQWDGPNGWAPLQWMSYKGLRQYGQDILADTLKARWLKTVLNQYLESGKLLEKYNVVYPGIPGGGGEYPNQDGFGWTNGVYLKMLEE